MDGLWRWYGWLGRQGRRRWSRCLWAEHECQHEDHAEGSTESERTHLKQDIQMAIPPHERPYYLVRTTFNLPGT